MVIGRCVAVPKHLHQTSLHLSVSNHSSDTFWVGLETIALLTLVFDCFE